MQSNIQKKIDHVVVLMMENRSLDNLLGWLYEHKQPHHFIPEGTPQQFNGLANADYANPLDLNDPHSEIKASKGTGNFRVPNPDPNEEFKHMNQQQYGLEIDKNTKHWLPKVHGSKPNMKGFLADYVTAKCSNEKIAPQIMQSYTPEDLTVLSSVAQQYAVSDNYHASSPTQTWPNRAFMHAGTSEGRVNNFPYLPYGSKTIFNVLKDEGVSWAVYKSSKIIPSLTRIQMTQLWHFDMDDNFKHVDDFIEACQNPDSNALPAYSFIEPSFVIEKGSTATSEHPPANVCAGDHFLEKIVNAVTSSPHFDKILFIINFDENGGCPDHVPPPWSAVPPDEKSKNSPSGFKFDRYGVRVPALFISPYINPQTCIRASKTPWLWHNNNDDQDVVRPFDHTSILAMLLDWKNIDRALLPSKRVLDAPKNVFDDLLASNANNYHSSFTALCTYKKPSLWTRLKSFIKHLFDKCAGEHSLTSLQKSIIAADLHYRKARSQGFKTDTFAREDEVNEILNKITTEKHMRSYFQSMNKTD